MPLVVVVMGPFRVVVPVPAVCVMDLAVVVPTGMLFALLMVRSFSGVVPPTAAPKVMFPQPAVRVRVWAPSMVLAKEMFAPVEV